MSPDRTKIVFGFFILFVIVGLAVVSSRTVLRPIPETVYLQDEVDGINPLPLGQAWPTPVTTQAPGEISPDTDPLVPSGYEDIGPLATPYTPISTGSPGQTPKIPTEEERPKTPTLYYPSVYYGAWGSSLTLTGDGLAATGNTVNFGKHSVTGLSSIGDGRGIVFRIPESVPVGRYMVTVSSADGLASPGVPFIVTPQGAVAPTVTGVSALAVRAGDTLRITGSGFAAEGNDVLLGYATIRNVSSPDGRTLEIQVPSFAAFDEVTIAKGHDMPIGVVVANDNGIGGYSQVLALHL